MRCLLVSLSLVIVFSSSVFAQQMGNADRDYTINGIGSNAPSFVSSTVGVASLLENQYNTPHPNAPVIWAIASAGSIGWILTPTNSVDIGPAGLIFMLDGTFVTSSNPINNFARTNAAGDFTINIVAPVSLSGITAHLAMAHATPASPDGFFVSQTHVVSFITDPSLAPSNPTCNPASTPLALTDDSFSQQPLGFSYSFYGTTYTDCFVGSNGYVTFGTGSTVYVESVTTFLSGEPSIRGFWDDMNPAAGGSVSFLSDGATSFEVCFTNVPEFAQTNQNSFKMLAGPGFISFDYGAMAALDGLVGLSPGGSLATGLPLNLSISPNTIPAATAPYQLFVVASPMDLPGFQVNFLLDAGGTPLTQF